MAHSQSIARSLIKCSYINFFSFSFSPDQKALIQKEKDSARMAEVFLELDDDADGL